MARTKTDIQGISYDDEKELFYIYQNVEGNKRYETARTKAEAKRKKREFEAKKQFQLLQKPNSKTLLDWLHYWMESVVAVNNARSTYEGYQAIIHHIQSDPLGDIPLGELTGQDLQSYFARKRKEPNPQTGKCLSENTVKKHHTLLQTALKLAVAQKEIVHNPLNGVTPPKTTTAEIEVYEANDLRILFEKIQGTTLEPAIYVAGYLGLRREELCAIRWSDINWEDSYISISRAVVVLRNGILDHKNTKTSVSTRKLFLVPALRDKLKEIYERQMLWRDTLGHSYQDNDYIVVNEWGKSIKPNYLSQMISRFIKENGLKHIHLRGLRHTVASLANENGSTIYDIGKLLGHSQITTTTRYMHSFQKTNQTAAQKVSERIEQEKIENNIVPREMKEEDKKDLLYEMMKSILRA